MSLEAATTDELADRVGIIGEGDEAAWGLCATLALAKAPRYK